MGYLEAITPKSQNINIITKFFALLNHVLSNPKTIHDLTSIYNKKTQENFQIPSLLG
jgi:hypothetical protein